MFSNPKNSKKLINYSCEFCDFVSCNKNDYRRHNQTQKHFINVFQSEKTRKNSYKCSCGKIYKDNSGLWRHKKICTINETFENEQIETHEENINNNINIEQQLKNTEVLIQYLLHLLTFQTPIYYKVIR